jgi:hypothetical protein
MPEDSNLNTHTPSEHIACNRVGATKKSLSTSTLMQILGKANDVTFQTEKLQSHLTTTESSSFYLKLTSYVWVILFTKMSSWISLIKNKIGRVREGNKTMPRTNLWQQCNWNLGTMQQLKVSREEVRAIYCTCRTVSIKTMNVKGRDMERVTITWINCKSSPTPTSEGRKENRWRSMEKER